jgi:hypothetical protein
MPSPTHLDASAHPPTDDAEEATSFGAWTLVWVLYGAKVATIVLVIWAEQSYKVALFVTITTWIWLGPLLAIGAAPLLYRYRLRRVRARRADLLRAEWQTDLPPVETPRKPHRGA